MGNESQKSGGRRRRNTNGTFKGRNTSGTSKNQAKLPSSSSSAAFKTTKTSSFGEQSNQQDEPSDKSKSLSGSQQNAYSSQHDSPHFSDTQLETSLPPTSIDGSRTTSVDDKNTPEAKPRNKRAFNSIGKGNPGRNLDPYKDEILKLSKDYTLGYIERHLFAKTKIKFSTSSIGNRVKRWGGTIFKKGVKRCGNPAVSKRNLTPWKAKLLEWDQAGSTVEEMSAQLKEELNVIAWPVYIAKALSFWKSSWRKMGEHPGLDDSEFVPVDLWTTEELQNLEDEIKAASLKDAQKTHVGVPDFARWSELLVSAACHDPAIQSLMVKEKLQPGHHWSSDRRFDRLWVLGLQLPGAYSHESVDTLAKIMRKVDSLTPKVLQKVYTILKECLEECISLATREYGKDYLQPALSMIPATTPPEFVSNFLRTCRHEINQTQSLIRLRNTLALIPCHEAHSCLEKCHDYLKSQREIPSLVDQFTTAVLDELEFWKQPWMMLNNLPGLEPSDMDIDETYKRPKEYQPKGKGCERESEELPSGSGGYDSPDDDFEDHTQSASTGRQVNRQDHNYGKLYLILSDWVLAKMTPSPMVFKRWRTLTSGPLLGSPPARFQTETWDPPRLPVVSAKVSDEKSGGPNQETINMPTDYPDRSIPKHEPSDYEKSVLYTTNIRKSQTAKEKGEFEGIIQRMRACTSRPPGADKLAQHVDWGSVLRDDNWYHCRRLLQMIAQRCQFTDETYSMFEQQLMMILAAIEGGSTEAVVWVIPLEGLLTRISKHAGQQYEKLDPKDRHSRRVQAEQIRELVAFAHGVAQCNAALRFHWRRSNSGGSGGKAPTDVPTSVKWYAMLYRCDPRCSRLECLKLLPSPRAMKENKNRDTFSVGVVDARTGSRMVRSFIAANRSQISPCLVGWVRDRDPQPALVCTFQWYGQRFHTQTPCKHLRGKWEENF
ncbi:uncharacterized protein PAC_09018 [Phialocephala subalpina]|uniref:Uncharacterized protein n=1 Tax=Phialocephala subalpina TaxID=576137 RepID=A0A1L7X267_9HELO|nr:uncharacterized protein PAC_09018 [Phialocephala subalpina]